MANKLRAVVDTNVVISAALLPNSVTRQAVEHAIENGVLLLSESTYHELHEVLLQNRFDRYVSQERRLEFMVGLLIQAEVVTVSESLTECRDPKDNKFLELACSGAASHIVTGDNDLLVLHPFRGVAILTPRAFLSQ